MTNLISISDARANLPDLVTRIDKHLDRAVITVNGQPKAVMLSIDELESLEETAEVLAIPNIMRDLATSRRQIKQGKFTRISELD